MLFRWIAPLRLRLQVDIAFSYYDGTRTVPWGSPEEVAFTKKCLARNLLRFFCKIFRFHFGRTNYFLGTSLKTVELPRKHQWCSLPLVQAPSPQGHLGWLQWLGADVWWLRFISGSFQRFEEISNIPLEHTPDPTIHTSLWRKFFHTF